MGASLVVPPVPHRASRWAIAVAVLLLGIAVILIRRRNSAELSSLLRRVKQRCSREMSGVEAQRAWNAVASAQRLMPARTACLETSVTLILFGALTGRSLDWCVGVRLAPFESHAWVEVDGAAVLEPARSRHYHKILTI